MRVLAAVPLLLASIAASIPSDARQLLGNPSIIIKNGTIIGSTSNSIDSFKGIPFAQPPTGALRLKPPRSITTPFGTIQATGTPTSCPQMGTYYNTSTLSGMLQNGINNNPALNAATGPTGEDCLTLNVQRPSNASPAKPLPVLFWIYGGGFEFGSTQMYDGTQIVQKSVSLGAPVIFVAVNYRVSGYGFLAGKELQKDGSTNLGLRDQRLGLQWVADNIAAFGGDPNRVTIWGESAGSISVFDHLLINGGDNTYHGKPLFIAGIMDSGSAVPTSPVNAAKPQAVYDQVVKAAGCSKATDNLQCLRGLPYQDFQNACNAVPGLSSYQSLDLSYLPRYDPSDKFFSRSPEAAVEAGAIAKVPIIIGDQEDEGTIFAGQLSNVTTSDDLVTYLTSYFPDATRADIAGLVHNYPDDPSAGSPFNTGPFNELYSGYKRNAALLGDITFTLTRRVTLQIRERITKGQPAWSYLASYFSGTPYVGTFHGSDILEAFSGLPYSSVQNTILTYYISFVNTLDPNKFGAKTGAINWPQWNSTQPALLHVLQASNEIIPDTFRKASSDYLASHINVLHV